MHHGNPALTRCWNGAQSRRPQELTVNQVMGTYSQAGWTGGMTTPQDELLPGTCRALLHRIAVAQTEGRAPSLVAAVVRDGRAVWHGSRTSVDGHGPDENVQYRIGSITKTFTAVLVLRLRDEGLLDLGDSLEEHLPGTGAGEATIAELLAHTSGLAAESPAPWWERTPGSLRPELADVLGDHPFRQPVGRHFHYSNPGYTLLGALVEKLRGAPWKDVLRLEVLEPLGLNRTSVQPQAPHAGGWAVHPWADVLLPEPAEDLGRMAPAGQLWSTTGDLARFAVFLTQGNDRVRGGGVGQLHFRAGAVRRRCRSCPHRRRGRAADSRSVASAARSRHVGTGVGRAVVLGDAWLRPAADGRRARLTGAVVRQWPPLSFPGQR